MLMHGRPLVYRHHAFWRGRAVAQRTMWSDCVEVAPPTLEQDIARIHGPVGIKLGGRHPAEIAVSIMAEVTRVLRTS